MRERREPPRRLEEVKPSSILGIAAKSRWTERTDPEGAVTGQLLLPGFNADGGIISEKGAHRIARRRCPPGSRSRVDLASFLVRRDVGTGIGGCWGSRSVDKSGESAAALKWAPPAVASKSGSSLAKTMACRSIQNLPLQRTTL